MHDVSITRTPRRWEVADALPFIVCHLAVLGALWSGVTTSAVVVAVVLYGVRMFFVTAGYHRYFSHRTYKTSRVGQAVLAFMAQTSAQKGAIWWASHHRRHHRLSDRPGDVHSPRQDGLFYAHVGWIFNGTGATDWGLVKDLARYPELVFLNRWYLLPPTVLAVAVLVLFGWSGLFIGFFASTVAVWHGTFVINSLAHVIGRRRFPTLDDSRNSVWLALVTFGEGWHNNHHSYMASTRQGFYWWELDLTYYLLRLGAALGLVWDLREPPASHLTEGRARDRVVWRQRSVAMPSAATSSLAATDAV